MLSFTFSWARWQALFSLDQTKMCWNEPIFLPFCCWWHSLSILLLPCWHLVVVPRPCLTCSCLADTWLLYQGLVWPALALLTLGCCTKALSDLLLPCWHLVVVPRPCLTCSCLADTWLLYQGLVWPALALLTLGCCTKALSDLLLPCWHLVVVPRPCLTCSCLADTWLLYQGLVWPALALLTLVLTRPCLSCSCLADTCPNKALSILLLLCWHLSYQGRVHQDCSCLAECQLVRPTLHLAHTRLSYQGLVSGSAMAQRSRAFSVWLFQGSPVQRTAVGMLCTCFFRH